MVHTQLVVNITSESTPNLLFKRFRRLSLPIIGVWEELALGGPCVAEIGVTVRVSGFPWRWIK